MAVLPMADDDLVTIAKYGSPQDAQLTKSVLEGQGIRACVVDDATTGWLWYLGTALGGAKLQVSKRDVELAKDTLWDIQAEDRSSCARPWVCPLCGADVDAGFDVCWSCESPMGELSAGESSAKSNLSDDRACGSEDGQSIEDVPSPADADATRAFRAAIFGMKFPPLLLYAAYLVVKMMGQELSPSATQRFYVALAICLVFVTFWWYVMFRL